MEKLASVGWKSPKVSINATNWLHKFILQMARNSLNIEKIVPIIK